MSQDKQTDIQEDHTGCNCYDCIQERIGEAQINPEPEPVTIHNPPSALKKQVGGNHYKNFKIQPIEYIFKNDLNFLQGNVVKYITRYNQASGRGKEDLKKIKHYIDLLIELEGY